MSEFDPATRTVPQENVDSRAFRQTVGRFVTGVTVIATEIHGEIRAMTANSFTSLSLEPPLVLFCVGKATRTGRLVHSASGFSVNCIEPRRRARRSCSAEGVTPPFARRPMPRVST